ncbi:MAG TPA: cupin domain-containing protein [Actinomycetota bacterium]|nr:cupin domain-containing protein [Actinomycetota bacterium]
MANVLRVRPGERVAGPTTPGMVREQAIATEDLWCGFVTTRPGMASGWHHHGGHRTLFYVLSGVVRIEHGAGGGESFDAEPGDIVLIPDQEVHRESNPASEPASVVVVRAGAGETVVNVEGPAG